MRRNSAYLGLTRVCTRTVLRAYDRELDKVVALKVLHPSLADDKGAVERFRNEIRLALEITHKNVCRTYGLERVNGKILISMEYIDGETLRSILDRVKGVSVPQGVSWTQEICDGLAAAHEKGIVHRDVKPENIMIDRNGHAKVMDFGIARSIEPGDRTAGTRIGTPQYMSPEQAMGKALAPTTDIYSLGLVLYEMFAGDKVDSMNPRRPSEVNSLLPLQIDRAILKCLAEHPEDRFQTVHQLAASLRPLAVSNETEWQAKTGRRLKVGLWAAFVAVGIGLALSLTLIRRKPPTLTPPATSQIAPKSAPTVSNQPGTPPSSVAQNTSSQSTAASGRSTVKAAQPKADNVNVDGAWSATIADAKISAALQFNLVQNSEGDVVGTYTSSLGGGGSLKASVQGQLLTFELTQSIKDCPGIFKGTVTVAGGKGTGKYGGTDCLGDHGHGTLTMTKGVQVLAERQQIVGSGIGAYLRTKLLRWTLEDANNVIGAPVTHRYGYDNAQSVVTDIYTYRDPAFQIVDYIELAFDARTKRLKEVYLYPKDGIAITADQAKQLWGDNFEAITRPDGTQIHDYSNSRMRVVFDKDNKVINTVLY
jgi:serine/threonine protein kinase